MLIRCDKCTTLYELDDKLIPRQGAPVQCSRCQFVFTAYPPGEGGKGSSSDRETENILAGTGASPGAATRSGAAASPQGPGPAQGLGRPPRRDTKKTMAASVPLSELPPDAKFTSDGRPIRKVAFPTEETPRPPPARTPARASVPVPPTSRRPLWLFAVVVLVVAALLLAAAWWIMRRGEPAGLHHRAPVSMERHERAREAALPLEGRGRKGRVGQRGSKGPRLGAWSSWAG